LLGQLSEFFGASFQARMFPLDIDIESSALVHRYPFWQSVAASASIFPC
jgi:hypothetical protein